MPWKPLLVLPQAGGIVRVPDAPLPFTTVAPVATGTAVETSVVSTTDGTWASMPFSFTYQWQKSDNGTTGWTNITAAAASTYTLAETLVDKYVRCAVTGTNINGAGTAYSNAIGPIAEIGIEQDLLAYWKLEETSGVRYDATANGYDLTDVNDTGYGTGVIGNCATFDDESVQGLEYSEFPDLTTFTIAAWVKCTDELAWYRVIASKWDGGGGWNFFFGVSPAGELLIDVGDGGSSPVGALFSETVITDDEWHLCVVVCDPDNELLKLSVDGAAFEILEITSAPQGSTMPLQIASNTAQGVSNFDGSIDEVAIWERALTISEIVELYNDGDGMTII